MLDNFDLIKNLISFKKEGDFYRILVLVRKSDQTTNKANHQSARIIKEYTIYSLEYLEEKYEEMKTLAEIFKARVYFNPNRFNDENVTLFMLKELVNRIESKCRRNQHLYQSVVGNLKSEEKRWVVDIDFKGDISHIISHINELEPIDKEKIIEIVPTMKCRKAPVFKQEI